MIELQRAQNQADQKNMDRYCRLLATQLTHIERQHMRRRIAQEGAELERAQIRARKATRAEAEVLHEELRHGTTYRIGVIMAGLVVAIGISIAGASAQSCDDRIAGSCSTQVGNVLSESEAVTSAGKEARLKKRALRAPRKASRSARKKSVRAVVVRRQQPVEKLDKRGGDATYSQMTDAARKVAAHVTPASAEPPAPASPPTNATSGTMPGSVSTLSSMFLAQPATRSSSLTSDLSQANSAQAEAAGQMTGSAAFDQVPAQEPSSAGRASQPPVKGALADNTQRPFVLSAHQAAAPGTSAAAETSWTRLMIMAFGGLLAAGSIIRLVV